MKKLSDKFSNFTKALKRLNEANAVYKNHVDDDIFQDALIKRFEFTFELAWKTLREYMAEQGYAGEVVSPKRVLSVAFCEGFIDNEEIWLSMLDDRNLSAHEYSRESSFEIAERISGKYLREFSKLSKLLSKGL